ncbi:MAG: hypothetical protein KDB71_05840 [Mycobacterium sp.]|nr:hypothetical protein [Mycobacterium sp.]
MSGFKAQLVITAVVIEGRRKRDVARDYQLSPTEFDNWSSRAELRRILRQSATTGPGTDS